jgi:dUTP pyrophosphatase
MLPVLLEVKDGNVQVISAHILQEVVIRNIDRGDKPFSSEEIDHIILAHTCTIDNDITIPPGDLTPTFTDDYPYETISTVVDVEIQKLHEKAVVPPQRMTEGSVGYDLCAVGYTRILPGCTQAIPVGFAIAIPCDYEGQIRTRSGMALKHSVHVLNSPGTIDSDYRGEVKVLLHNAGAEDFNVYEGDRVAQLLIKYAPPILFKVVDKLSETNRGEGGFGHTGK